MTTESRPPSTRERILEAAMDVFAEQGFTGATISEVERRVGLAVGTGSLYRHFPSKEALLAAAVEREVTRLRTEMAAAEEEAEQHVAPGDEAQRRRRAYEQRLHHLRRFDRLFRLMLTEGERVPELRQAIWAVLQVPVKPDPDDSDVLRAIAESALGGYHLFSIMQGRPYNGVSEDRFLSALVAVTTAP
ncbi:TetR/AcrR family transcriptional regulator [Trujillonella endophytica]|uniref:Transcriptional regulator, TetR family n=1 Tax=Trujillonella endophytica TaxID=673521 RepID=A0A1H8WGF1_9ACTN|nr:TetR/AcrR family transcriptional regulator [Trujillella endophytica]SEP26745.1 transcriptional regulator, TetR family [Trujillella endophytica]